MADETSTGAKVAIAGGAIAVLGGLFAAFSKSKPKPQSGMQGPPRLPKRSCGKCGR